jgi:hypothetical protein
MLSKCTNPECSATFLYLHRGRLFRIETIGREDRRRLLEDQAGARKPMRRIEFYWLCEDCAEKMTLTFDKQEGVVVRAQAATVVERAAATAA